MLSLVEQSILVFPPMEGWLATMPTERFRLRDDRTNIHGTRYHRTFGTSNRNSLVGSWANCTDVVGNYPNPNAFALGERHSSVPVLDGTLTDSSGIVIEYSHAPIQYSWSMPEPTAYFASDLSSLEKAQMYTQILAKTNPNVAETNIPQFIAEFGDLPDVVRSVKGFWQDVFKLAAFGYLSWRWIVRPFLSDLEVLSTFVHRVNDRLEQLEKLRTGEPLSVRVRLRSRTAESTSAPIVESQDVVLRGIRTDLYTEKVWGSIRWRLAPGVKLPKQLGDLRHLAEMQEMGFSSYNAIRTLWELTPWSWMIDWFVDIGEFIDAYDGTIPVYSDDCCIMRTIEGRSRFGPLYTLPSWLTSSGSFDARVTVKKRYVVSGVPIPSLSFPFLSKDKYAILGALSVVRGADFLGLDAITPQGIRSFLKSEYGSSVYVPKSIRKAKGRGITRKDRQLYNIGHWPDADPSSIALARLGARQRGAPAPSKYVPTPIGWRVLTPAGGKSTNLPNQIGRW